tara:strand:+ start:52 stop:885 length:834 start_codon:yes stop_codon:yes gene_type:complete
MNPLVETDWLFKNINNVRIFDATWHLPNLNRNAEKEFEAKHIQGSVFFDIDKHSNKKSNLPHMMPDKKKWEKVISDFGIKNTDHVIIYDNSDLYSSCRLWFSFIYFGHDTNLVSVLNGGLKKWLIEKKEVTTKIKKFNKSVYSAEEKEYLILKKQNIDENIKIKKFKLVDARSEERFLGKVKEPRKGLKSGSIPGSLNLPYKDCINSAENTFKNKKDLKIIFDKLDLKDKVAFTCGSGVTACVLGLVNSLINDTNPLIYDGSWSEYGILRYEDSNKN